MSSDEKQRYSFATDDEMAIEILETAENRSEIIRDGVKRVAAEQMSNQVSASQLSEDQRAALAWMVERTGGRERSQMRMSTARRKISQLCQIPKDMVRVEIFEPLRAEGYLDVITGINAVRLRVYPPTEVGE